MRYPTRRNGHRATGIEVLGRALAKGKTNRSECHLGQRPRSVIPTSSEPTVKSGGCGGRRVGRSGEHSARQARAVVVRLFRARRYPANRASNDALFCLSGALDDEWDEYEWRYARPVETFVAENPDGPDAEEMLRKIRTWRDAYLRWGRDTLGFGLYLLRRPCSDKAAPGESHL